MEMDDFVKEINRIKQENDALQNLKRRYVETAAKIKSIGEDLVELSKQIDPAITLGEGRARSKNYDYEEILHDLHEKMIGGFQITSEILKATYPELRTNQIYQLALKIEEFPGVQKVKDGKKVRYFYKK